MASVSISVKSDIDKAVRHFEALSAGLKSLATVRALNRVAEMARTAASREIRQTYRMKARDVNAAIKINRASARAGLIEASVVAKGKHSIPLVEFTARQTKTGVSVSVKRAGGRKRIPSGFIATMGNSHRGVFVRKGKSRLPIEELFTIGVPYQFAARKTVEAMARIIREKFPDRLMHELSLMVRKGGAA